MPKAKPPLIRLGDMKPGQCGDFFALLAERSRGVHQDGNSYFACRFADLARSAVVLLRADDPWFQVCDSDWKEGAFYRIQGVYSEHPTHGPQLELANIRAAVAADTDDGFDSLMFVPQTTFDVEAMYDELWMLAESSIGDVPLRRLVLTLLTKTAKPLKRVPASRQDFFPFAGGLLEHTLSVTHSCVHLVDKYANHYSDLEPPINRDIVVAAAILHDLGRAREYDAIGIESSIPGPAIGYSILSRDLIRDTAKELGDVDADLLGLLEHVVLSHVDAPASESPSLPLVPEAIILHHADDLDAKLEMYVHSVNRDKENGPYRTCVPFIGKNLYKLR